MIVDWEKYTGKKSKPNEASWPLTEVLVEKQRDGEWKIIEGKDLGKAIIGTIPPRPMLKWEDVKITAGGIQVKGIAPIPDDVKELIAAARAAFEGVAAGTELWNDCSNRLLRAVRALDGKY